MDNKKKSNLRIRAIRCPSTEIDSQYVVIDNFNPSEKDYQLCCKVYDTLYKNVNGKMKFYRGEKLLHPRLTTSFGKAEGDLEELPDVNMYLVLSQMLKKCGYIFNKKKEEPPITRPVIRGT